MRVAPFGTVEPLTDDELEDIRAMTPPSSHPLMLRLLATIDAQRAELDRLRPRQAAPVVVEEQATETSGCRRGCGRPIAKGERRVRVKQRGSAFLFHPECVPQDGE